MDDCNTLPEHIPAPPQVTANLIMSSSKFALCKGPTALVMFLC